MTNWIQSLLDIAAAQQKSKMPWLDKYSPIFIYGTGTFAQDIHRVLLDNGLPIHGFLDHMGRASHINGLPVYTPEEAIKRTGIQEDTTIILGIHNYQADLPGIQQHLAATGFQKIVTSVELYDFFGQALGVRYWLTSRDFYFPLTVILENAYALWEDETSKSLFKSILEYRLTGDVTKLPTPDLVNPYHPTDIPRWKTPLRLADCGAFDGDTLKDFIKNKIQIEAVAAFEPDLSNYAKLAQFASAHKDAISDMSIFPCGVYSTTTQLAFETGRGMASNISSKGTHVIQCVSMDDAIPTFAPNLIKMDIEGAEYDALLGAREIIRQHTPGLAVSLYHRPEHLWQLPLAVENIAPGKYKFYMRSHALNDFELVLYAIPKN